jgi:LmbE family N-acetylglucosaminyl deacetylase
MGMNLAADLMMSEAGLWSGFAALFDALGTPTLAGRHAMLVVAHPDDETIGMGGQLRALGGITIVHVTDGAPRNERDARAAGFSCWQDYARARREELAGAMAEAGIGAEALVSLGLADQSAARHLPALARTLAALFKGRGTRLVFTHAYEGGHPDHDAVAFAVQAAARQVAAEGGEPPVRIEMPFYHKGDNGLVVQRFAPEPNIPDIILALDDEALALKRRMLARHASQQHVLAGFDSQVERFRQAPVHDFTVLPNGGRLNYADFDWGLTGAQWLELTRAATAELGGAA